MEIDGSMACLAGIFIDHCEFWVREKSITERVNPSCCGIKMLWSPSQGEQDNVALFGPSVSYEFP